MSANVVKLRDADEEWDVLDFKRRVTAHYEHKVRFISKALEMDRRLGVKPDLDWLLMATGELWEMFTMLYMGLPDDEQEKLVDQLAPAWALMRGAEAKAKKFLAEQGATQGAS